MWLQIRLYLLVGVMFGILYGIIVGIGYLLGYSGMTFYLLIIGFALVLVILQYLIGPKTVEWSMRIRYIKKQDHPGLYRMVEDLSQRAGLPVTPRIGISRLQIPNAFAFGRSQRDARVCVTEGILQILGKEELQAVLGHEISHIQHRDVAIITLLSVIPMICYMIYISFFWSSMLSRGQRNAGGMLVIGLLALAVYFITSLLVMYGSRIREYYADLGSVSLGNPPYRLATALYRLSLGSARIPKHTLKQTEGMKAFFLNDPSRALSEIRELKEIDLDMSGTIDQHELMVLSAKKVRLSSTDKLMEALSTHPNMTKRIKHLASLSNP
jgi:heat shock protein HtpX